MFAIRTGSKVGDFLPCCHSNASRRRERGQIPCAGAQLSLPEHTVARTAQTTGSNVRLLPSPSLLPPAATTTRRINSSVTAQARFLSVEPKRVTMAFVAGDVDGAGSAHGRQERRQHSWWRHDLVSVAMNLVSASRHSAQPGERAVSNEALQGQKNTRAAGVRPGVLPFLPLLVSGPAHDYNRAGFHWPVWSRSAFWHA